MKITAIKQQVKNTGRVSIFVDGKYTFSLTLDQLLELKLKKGAEVDEPDVKKYKKLSDEGKLKQRALEWLMMRPHSSRELRDYLYRKKAEKEQIIAWEQEFTDKKYLDDRKFAQWFAEQRMRKNKSTRAITAELYSKGITQVTIQGVVTELETGDKEALKALVVKLSGRPRYKDQKRLMSYLAGRGFNYQDIKSALSDLSADNNN